MDIIALRSDLAAWLGHLLGNYRAKNGATFPAIYLGEPPSDYVFEVGAGGERLEVIVDAHQQGTVHRVHGGQRLEVSATIRLIPHGINRIVAETSNLCPPCTRCTVPCWCASTITSSRSPPAPTSKT